MRGSWSESEGGVSRPQTPSSLEDRKVFRVFPFGVSPTASRQCFRAIEKEYCRESIEVYSLGWPDWRACELVTHAPQWWIYSSAIACGMVSRRYLKGVQGGCIDSFGL